MLIIMDRPALMGYAKEVLITFLWMELSVDTQFHQ